jgi:hypothetical protein
LTRFCDSWSIIDLLAQGTHTDALKENITTLFHCKNSISVGIFVEKQFGKQLSCLFVMSWGFFSFQICPLSIKSNGIFYTDKMYFLYKYLLPGKLNLPGFCLPGLIYSKN